MSEDSIAANIAQWTKTNAEFTDPSAQRHWASEEIFWGVFSIPEARDRRRSATSNGLDVVELGCGTAYFSAWLAKRGARPVGVDPTPAQLATARRMQAETGIEFPLVEAPGESVPLPDASFDLALSEYGASLWADPAKWIPEAARLLRPRRPARLPHELDARLPLRARRVGVVTRAAAAAAVRDVPHHSGPEADGIEYHLAHGDWIALLRENGFEIEALHELRPARGRRRPRLLRLRHGRVGAQVARRGDLGSARS